MMRFCKSGKITAAVVREDSHQQLPLHIKKSIIRSEVSDAALQKRDNTISNNFFLVLIATRTQKVYVLCC
jgi:hypothetical protein